MERTRSCRSLQRALGDQHVRQETAEHAAPNALVWISYPKKTSKVEEKLSRDVIREAMKALDGAPSIVASTKSGPIALPANSPSSSRLGVAA